jgi:hypothetical protein
LKRKNLALVCVCVSLSVAPLSHAQFGKKLKDLANKAGKAAVPVAVPRAGAGTMDVQRGAAGTGNVTQSLNEIKGGETKEVKLSFHGSMTTDGLKAIDSPTCLKASNIRVTSPQEATITVTANQNASTGGCVLNLQNAQGMPIRLSFNVEKDPFGSEEAKLADAAIGSIWEVALPGGKKETWARTGRENAFTFEFSNPKGTAIKIHFMPSDSTAMVMLSETCMLQGNIKAGKAAGQSMSPYCTFPMSSKWSANIQ